MRYLVLFGFIGAIFGCQQKVIQASMVDGCPETLNHTVRTLNDGRQVNLCQEYAGKILLIVNTASKCIFTDQYESLEKLYDTYRDRGLIVLGFPSNDFGNQEPGTEKQVQEFCRLTYGVKFPMFSKTSVRAKNADPLFRTLGKMTGRYPQWNFYKYLLDQNGNIVASYSSMTNPMSSSVVDKIEQLVSEDKARN